MQTHLGNLTRTLKKRFAIGRMNFTNSVVAKMVMTWMIGFAPKPRPSTET